MISIDDIAFNSSDGLVPAVIQDQNTRQVLMLGYMNREAVIKTLETGKVTFFSRSKQRLWMKGEESGNVLHVVRMQEDCDNDTLLIEANPIGPTCHTGKTSCFHQFDYEPATGPASASNVSEQANVQSSITLDNDATKAPGNATTPAGEAVNIPDTKRLEFLSVLQQLLYERKKNLPEGSYTSKMFIKGRDKLAQKVGEEAVETVIAVKNSREEFTYEASDLLFHLMMLLVGEGMKLEDLVEELKKRHS